MIICKVIFEEGIPSLVHIWGNAQIISHMLYSMRRPLVTYDFAPYPFRISSCMICMRKFFLLFKSARKYIASHKWQLEKKDTWAEADLKLINGLFPVLRYVAAVWIKTVSNIIFPVLDIPLYEKLSVHICEVNVRFFYYSTSGNRSRVD